MTDYYFRAYRNRVTERQDKELTALDENQPRFHKYQTEYRFHGWLPPITVSPPRDNSITDLYI